MKTKISLFIVLTFLTTSTFSQNLLTPLKGQFFEQGYGQSETGKGNEEGIDIVFDQSFNNIGGALMAGWVEDTTEHYETFGTDNMDAAVWRIGAFGKQRIHFSFQGQLFEAATGIINGPSNKYAICVRKSPTYNTTHTVDLEDSLLVYQFDSIGNVDFITRFGVVNENYRDVGIAPVDIIYEGGELGYLVLANRIRKIEDAATKIEPVLVRVSTTGNLDTIVAYTNDYSVEAHELYKDQDNTIHFSANCFATTTYPMLVGFSNSLSNTFDYSYTGLSSTQVFGLAKHAFGYYAMAGYQYGESDTNAVVVVLDGDYAYDETWIAGEDHLTETFRDLNTHGEGIIAVGLRQSDSELGIGEGKKDVFICHFDNQGEITLEETMGSHKNDRVTHTESHPLQPATFFAGNHTGYGKDSTGNAYLGGVLFTELNQLYGGNSCDLPRLIQVEGLSGRDNNTGDIIPGILDENTTSKGDDLIQYCKDNKINHIALFKLGYIFDNLGNAADKKVYEGELERFVIKARNNGIVCGYVADQSINALDDAANYNINRHSFNQNAKLNFVKLEHEYWNVFNDIYFTQTLNGTQKPDLTDNNIDTTQVNPFYRELHQDHLFLITRLRQHKFNNANGWFVYDYLAWLYLNLPSQYSNKTSYGSTNNIARQAKASDLAPLSDAVFLSYYQHYQADTGKAFLKVNSSNGNVIKWRERVSYFGNTTKGKIVIPLFSAEDLNNCGGYPFLGNVLEGSPNGTENMHSVETAYINQHQAIFNDSTNYPHLKKIELSGFGWFKYACVENRNFSNKNLVSCNNLSFPITFLNTKEITLNKTDFILYPNPASENLTIELNNSEKSQLKIYSIDGKLQLNSMVSDLIEVIDISGLNSGFYFVTIESAKNSYSPKIFIKK